MRIVKIGWIVIAGAMAQAFGGTGWHKVSTSDFRRLEEINGSTKVILARPWGAAEVSIAQPDGSSPCSCGQLELTPPAGKESRWLAILLSALATGQTLYVYGNCQNGVMDVDGRNSTGRLQTE